MLIREFTPVLESPGTLGTGSSHKPRTAIFPSHGSPMLNTGIGMRNVRDYSEYYDRDDFDYGRAMAHFYGFKELSPQGESQLASTTISADLEGEISISVSFDILAFNCSSVRECDAGYVFHPLKCESFDLQAVKHGNRPYVFAPPQSALAKSTWAGTSENGKTQQLDTAEGGWFGFKHYYQVEPGAGPQSGESFLDNSQQHPLLLVDGVWQFGSTAETTIGGALLYDPDNFEFAAAGTQDIEEGHSWVDDFDGTPAVAGANNIYLYLRHWTVEAKLDTGYANLDKVPEPSPVDFSESSAVAVSDPMDMSFYELDTTLTSPGTGDFPLAGAWTRALSYTRYQLHPEAGVNNLLFMPWGDVLAQDPSGDPPGWAVSDDYADYGCRSINEEGDLVFPPDRALCFEADPYLGFALYLQLDETALSYISKFGSTYSTFYSGALAWGNLVGALHEYEYDDGEWYMPLTCRDTSFVGGALGQPLEFLFDNGSGVAFADTYACSVDGYGVLWPLPGDNELVGPPAGFGCDDSYELSGNDACNWPYWGDGRSNIKAVTESFERTWDFISWLPVDRMITNTGLLDSFPCTRVDTLAWYYCPCRCFDCGAFFFADLRFWTDLVDPHPTPICSDDYTVEGAIEVRMTSPATEILTSTVSLLPGWFRFEFDVNPRYASINNLAGRWGDEDIVFSDGFCWDPDTVYGSHVIGLSNLVLQNVDTEKEGLLPFSEFVVGASPPESGDNEPYWDTAYPNLTAPYICDGLWWYPDTLEEVCFRGGFSSMWRSSLLTHDELDYEDPHEAPFNNLEPNGSLWQTYKITFEERESAIGCANEDIYFNVCLSDEYSPITSVCDSDDDAVSLTCEFPGTYCQPGTGGEEVDTVSDTVDYDFLAFFRGMN